MMQTILSALNADLSHLIAGMLVCFYAWNRFNTPRTVRSQTSRFQYYGSGVAYVASCVGILVLFTWALTSRPEALDWLHFGSAGTLEPKLSGFDAPVVAALALTTLLPSFPFLRDLDTAMLSAFHRLGAIPFNALRWAQRLGAADVVVRTASLDRARQYVRKRPDLQDDLALQLTDDANADHIRHAFTEVVLMYVAYRDLEIHARFADAFSEIDQEFEAKMANFFGHCLGYFATVAQLSAQNLKPATDLSESARKVILASADDVRLILARALLYSCNNELAVANKFRAMGFNIAPARRIQMPVNLLCMDLLFVIALFVVATLFSSGNMPVEKAFAIGLMVAFNHVIAAVVVIVPKQTWRFADIGEVKEWPVLAYILSTLAALTIGVTASFLFYKFRIHFMQGSGPILPFQSQCKWLALSTSLAFFLAIDCDLFLKCKTPRGLRWFEGAALAVLMGGVGMLVMLWLKADQLALHMNAKPPSLLTPILLSAAIGFVFGCTIPHWYRTSPMRVCRLEGPAPLATPLGA